MRRIGLTTVTLATLGICLLFLWNYSIDKELSVPLLRGLDGWKVKTLLTIGDALPLDGQTGPDSTYTPVGIPDGIGATLLNETTLRIFVNHELTKHSGYAYSLHNGTQLTGARISYFDMNRTTLMIESGGMAYHTIFDRQGNPVTHAAQINEIGDPHDGLSRLCSSQLVQAGTHNFTDAIYFTGEEILDPLYHPYGGTLWALDILNHTLHAIPAVGRMSLENIATLQADKQHVAFLMGDDSSPQTLESHRFGELAKRPTPLDEVVGAPLWLYLGHINAPIADSHRDRSAHSFPTNQSFLNRNGLLVGDLFYFVADQNMNSPQHYHGTGEVLTGTWKPISVRDASQAGHPGYDAYGYKNGFTLRQEAKTGGAFQFARPEDFSSHPFDGTRAVFATTGRDSMYPEDSWGDDI